MKKVSLSVFLIGFIVLVICGSGHPSTHIASDCNVATIQAIIDTASAGDTISVPAGACTWNTTLNVTKAVTIIGAGSGSSTTCNSSTSTCITSNITANTNREDPTNYMISIYHSSTYASSYNILTRISGLWLDQARKSCGIFVRNYSATYPMTKLRIDNNIIYQNKVTEGLSYLTSLFIYGFVEGVVDNNKFISSDPYIMVYGWNDNSWWRLSGVDVGKEKAVFFEDNLFEKDYSEGSWDDNAPSIAIASGGSAVVRYNNFKISVQRPGGETYMDCAFQNHGNNTVNSFSARIGEFYGNKLVDDYNHAWRLYQLRGGKNMMFYNHLTTAATGLYYNVMEWEESAGRASDINSPVQGYCPNADARLWPTDLCKSEAWYNDVLTAPRSTANCYSCGRNNTGDSNTAQPQHVWKNYFWSNRYGTSNTLFDVRNTTSFSSYQDKQIVDNVHFFADKQGQTFTGILTLGTGSSVTDSPGVGCGPSVPTGSCTTGAAYWVTSQSCSEVPSSNIGAQSPIGSRTATNIITGTLYRCSDNTWTAYYTPYMYPHPLRAAGLMTDTTNSNYFKDVKGNTVWLSGHHTWANLQDISVNGDGAIFNWSSYITSLKNNGMNHIRLWTGLLPRSVCGTGTEIVTLFPWNRSTTCCARDGGNKFDLTSFNSSYFSRLASRVADAQANGIYVSIMLFEGYAFQFCRLDDDDGAGDAYPFSGDNNINGISDGFVYDDNGTKSGVNSMKAPGESGYVAAIFNAQKAYIDKVIETVDSYDNVLYEIANEAGGASNAWQDALIAYLKTKTTKPIGKTFAYSGGTDAQLTSSSADWVSFGGSTYQYTVSSVPTAPGTKVSILDTDHLGGGGSSVTASYLWKAFTRGHNLILMQNSIEDSTGNRVSQRAALSQMRTYVNKIDLKNMQPLGVMSSTGYSLEKAGEEYLIYQPANASFSVNLSGISSVFSVEWLNVATGATTTGSDISGGGSVSMSYPSPSTNTEGVVLYLKKKSVSGPTTHTAASCSDSDIRSKISIASRGDTIMVPPGSCSWTAPVVLDKAVSVVGSGSNGLDCGTSTCITSNLKNAGISISITRSGSIATVTQTAHGLSSGQIVYISGATQPEYNGQKTVTVTGTNTYTFTVSGTPASPATGSPTVGYRKGLHLFRVDLPSSDYNTLARVSNFYIDLDAWSEAWLATGPVNSSSYPTKIRLDNTYITNFPNLCGNATSATDSGIMTSGWIEGVIDNNTFDISYISTGTCEAAYTARWGNTWKACPVGATDSKCLSTTYFMPWTVGSSKNIFFEDNLFKFDSYMQVLLAGQGASFVARYNTFDYSKAPSYFYTNDTHGHQGGPYRGAFGAELYGNEIKANPSVTNQEVKFGEYRGSEHIIFNNKVTGNQAYGGIGIHNYYPVTWVSPTNPSGDAIFWACPAGTLDAGKLACSYDGKTQNPQKTYIWNNRNSRSSGSTFMIISSGRGSDCRSPTSAYCTTGSPDLTKCFPPVGTCDKYPSYLDYDIPWLRTDQDSSCTDPDSSACSAPNYEFWFDRGSWTKVTNTASLKAWRNDGTSDYNGTVGIGCGTLANRPSTCTQGTAYWVPENILDHPCDSVPTGTFGKNPTKPIKGMLYICGSNGWSNATTYSPYPYPHPIRGFGPVPPTSETDPPAFVQGSVRPYPTPSIECSYPAQDITSQFQVQDETGPVTCLGCVNGIDGCTSTSTYTEMSVMASKIVFTSSQSGSTFSQSATKSSECLTTYNIYASCRDGLGNTMTSSIPISYSLSPSGPETDAPELSSVTLGTDGRTVSWVFNEPVTVDTSYNSGKDINISNMGDYGSIYAYGSGTNTLVYQVAECLPSTLSSPTVQYFQAGDIIQDLVGNDFPTMESPMALTNNSTRTCGETDGLFDRSDTPGYSLYSQGSAGPTILGVRIENKSSTPKNLEEVCFYKDLTMDGEEHVAAVFGPLGTNPQTLLAQKTFSGETSSGWQCQALDSPVKLATNTSYVVAVKFPNVWLKASRFFATVYVSDSLSLTVDPPGGRWVDDTSLVYPLNATDSNFWIDFKVSEQSESGPWEVTMVREGAGCGISPQDPQVINDGDSVSATVILNPGWQAAWSSTCSGGSADGNIYTVPVVTEDCSITVTCTEILRAPFLLAP